MTSKTQRKRVRLLVKRLNAERKKQARKIDILCNDIIAAQRSFIETISRLTFEATLYESIIGLDNLNQLFYVAAKLITDHIGDADIAFFLPEDKSFQLYAFEGSPSGQQEQINLPEHFSAELVSAVTSSNRTCTLDDLFGLGLQISPALQKTLSAFTLPLAESGSSVGFMLIYSRSGRCATEQQVKDLMAIGPGLFRAIKSCRAGVSSGD